MSDRKQASWARPSPAQGVWHPATSSVSEGRPWDTAGRVTLGGPLSGQSSSQGVAALGSTGFGVCVPSEKSWHPPQGFLKSPKKGVECDPAPPPPHQPCQPCQPQGICLGFGKAASTELPVPEKRLNQQRVLLVFIISETKEFCLPGRRSRSTAHQVTSLKMSSEMNNETVIKRLMAVQAQ